MDRKSWGPTTVAKRRYNKVHLQFPTTNNEMEYEAIFSGLDLAKAVGVMLVVIHYDSQVVVRHINLAPTEVDYVMKEFHKGVCGNH